MERSEIEEKPIAFYRLDYGEGGWLNFSITETHNGILLSLSREEERYVYNLDSNVKFDKIDKDNYIKHALNLLLSHSKIDDYPDMLRDFISANEKGKTETSFEYIFKYEDSDKNEVSEDDFLDFLKKLNNISDE